MSLRLNVTSESLVDDKKAISYDLFNEGYRDIPEMEVQISIRISGVGRKFLESPLLPDLSFIEKDLNGSISNPIVISVTSVQSDKENGVKSITYIAKQELIFKSWSLIQINAILPYIQYDTVSFEIKANEDVKQIYQNIHGNSLTFLKLINKRIPREHNSIHQ